MIVRDATNTQRRSDVGLASTRTTDKHHIVSLLDEFTAVKAAHQGFIDFAVGKVKSRQISVDRKLGGLELIGNGAYFSLCALGFE